MTILRRIAGRTEIVMTRGDLALLYGGIFFTFAAGGWMLASVINEPMFGIGGGLYTAFIGGFSACLWAHCFISRRYWLLPLVGVWQAIAPWWLARHVVPVSLFMWGMQDSTRHKAAALSIGAILCLIVGYICGVRFAGRLERRTVRAQAELDVAKLMHESLVPPIELDVPGAHILGKSVPSAEMGGDLIDVITADGRTDLILADVSGHGVGAGIVMGMLKSAARAISRRDPELPELLAELNTVLAELVRPGMFATTGVLRLRENAHVEYALAGHLPILHRAAADGRVTDLPNDALPLAIDSAEQFRAERLDVRPGDTLLLFTDGLTEVMDTNGRQLGLAAFRDAFAAHGGRPLSEAAEALLAAASAHGPQADDQSLVLVRVH